MTDDLKSRWAQFAAAALSSMLVKGDDYNACVAEAAGMADELLRLYRERWPEQTSRPRANEGI